MKRLFFLLVCVSGWPATASAHVLDEYLQAAKMSVSPFGVHLDLRLTPGVEVADRVLAAIDLDRDGRISLEETEAYGERVSQELALEIDGRRVALAYNGFRFPSQDEIRNGDSAMGFQFFVNAHSIQAGDEQFGAGEHRIVFRNDHWPELSAYQANVLAPKFETIRITEQQRDPLQRELRLRFHVESEVALASETAVARATWSDWTLVLVGGSVVTLLVAYRARRRLSARRRLAP